MQQPATPTDAGLAADEIDPLIPMLSEQAFSAALQTGPSLSVAIYTQSPLTASPAFILDDAFPALARVDTCSTDDLTSSPSANKGGSASASPEDGTKQKKRFFPRSSPYLTKALGGSYIQ
jgi:hypothetical protein